MRLNLLNHCRIFGLVAIIYISIARSQRTSANGSQFNHNITTKAKNPKPNPSSYPNNIPLKNEDKFPNLPSFACVTNGIAKPTVDTSSTNANIRALVLNDQDLINVEDLSMMLLVKLKDIQFPSSSSADNFRTNASLKSIYSCIKTATPSFKVDERMIWIEIRGLPLYETLDSYDNIDVNGMEKVEDYVDENSLSDLNDLNDLKETINELASNEIQHPTSKENIDKQDDINNVSPKIGVSSDLSRPPGYEHMKITSSKCSTSFARY
ncbi:hypothetical protein Tco_0555533 [Tanacetum coccineum]